MVIDDKLLSKLEELSHLKVAPEKREEIKEELSNILNFVENLNQLDTDGLPDKFSMRDTYSHLRDDNIEVDRNIGKSVVENSPKHKDSSFVVPRIV